MGEAALVTPLAADPVCRVAGFAKRYGRQTAVAGVDLQLRAGEIYGLIGPDGAGKSSLMKAVAGVLDFEQGEIEVFGVRLDSESAAERIKDRIGFMPQGLGLNLYAELSVEENIDFFARLREIPAPLLAERKALLLQMTRLAPFRDRAMKHLSGGMKQKLGLICTLIHEPRLIILDEPTTGVDPVSRRDFWAILTQLLRERAISALVSTAYLDEASRFQRLSLMYQGRVLAEGEPEAILERAPGSLVELQPAEPLAALQRLRDRWPQLEAVGPRLRVFVPGLATEAAVAEVRAVLGPLDSGCPLRAGEPELEDAFIALLQRQQADDEAAAGQAPSSPPPPAAPAGDDGIAIEARELSRDFGDFRAVDRVSFRVAQGEIFGLLGANGAGKTTVIKMLTGILPPSGGEGRVAGADMRRAGAAIKQRIGYMSQAFSLYRDLSVLENLRLYSGIYGLPRRQATERIAELLLMAGLQDRAETLVGALPMGIRQRLALACALVHRPRVLFLDEPTSGVDPLGRRRFWELLVGLSRHDRVSILVTTHYMSEAEHCDRLALMHAGRIVADASPQAMKQALTAEVGELLSLRVDQPLAALDALEAAGFRDVALFGTRIHLFARDPAAARTTIEHLLRGHGLQLLGSEIRPPSMEDVFVHRILSLEREAASP
ncbi:ATP-binding cassette domain-containing protein [Thiohalobacter sp. IOR34]|uniref:ATP-binding cassette domain-containing protein n=1 Tax=Thiohalobacter sp. IOR34 TaxID=3057176 RepID=UPI0025B1FA15|nr:ATP-binding cassette domain-containing protein [Thiohalobacter sp. IOR34]WJW76345.1 ATP-binding cassette domain-containing protein [Thiohalobacter sp. IOR34]